MPTNRPPATERAEGELVARRESGGPPCLCEPGYEHIAACPRSTLPRAYEVVRKDWPDLTLALFAEREQAEEQYGDDSRVTIRPLYASPPAAVGPEGELREALEAIRRVVAEDSGDDALLRIDNLAIRALSPQEKPK